MHLVLSVTYTPQLDRSIVVIDAPKFKPNDTLIIDENPLQIQALQIQENLTYLVDLSKQTCIGKILNALRKKAQHEYSKL